MSETPRGNPPVNGKTFDWPAAYRELADWADALDRNAEPSAEETRDILRRRARQLAKIEAGEAATTVIDMLTFGCGGGRYGLAVSQLEAVITPEGLIPVPCTPLAIRGVINHRGQILAVVDIAGYLGLPPAMEPLDGQRVVIVEGRGRRLGILAEPPLTIERLEPARTISVAALLLQDETVAFEGITPSRVILLDAELLTHDPKVTVNHDSD